MIPFSPKHVNIHVEKVLEKLNAEIEPELVSIVTEEYSKEGNCFINVEEKVKRDGGNALYGWAILQGEFLCEAERHTVWENENGDLVDITPRPYGIKEILFVPDENFVYKGQLEDNVRINITSNPIVDDFILICEYLEKVDANGTRLNDDQIELPPKAAHLREVLFNLKNNTYYFLKKMHGKLNKSCWCNSNLPYRNCHHKNLEADLIEMYTSTFPSKDDPE